MLLGFGIPFHGHPGTAGPILDTRLEIRWCSCLKGSDCRFLFRTDPSIFRVKLGAVRVKLGGVRGAQVSSRRSPHRSH